MNENIREQLGAAAGATPTTEPSPVVPAATVVVCRDGSEGIEVLLVHRNSTIAFGGAWVFPGGKVEADDTGSERSDEEPEIANARVAAVREAGEEAGIALDVAALEVWSHWMPPASAPRRFSTWFFVAPGTDERVVIDDGEITDHAWMSPATALSRHGAREIELTPPTWVTLHDVGLFESTQALLDAAASAATPRYATRLGRIDDDPVVLWDPDAAWTTGDTSLAGPRNRLILRREGWELQRSPT